MGKVVFIGLLVAFYLGYRIYSVGYATGMDLVVSLSLGIVLVLATLFFGHRSHRR